MTHPMFSQEEVDTYDVLKAGLVKSRDTAMAKIHVDLSSGAIRVVQRWKYVWTLDEVPGPPRRKAADWTDDEQRDYHYAASSLIWKFWNSRVPLPASTDPTTQNIINLLNRKTGILFKVSGRGDFAEKFAGKQLPMDFDLQISPKSFHYTVNVRKMLPGRDREFVANVNHGSRTIFLKKASVEPRSAQQDGRNPAVRNGFIPLPHEFGHALGYDIDEYRAFAVNRADVDSLMNVGAEVRPRHLAFVRTTLNGMFPGAQFILPAA